jgi:hypothetical protein
MPKASPALFQISRAVIAAALLAVASGLGGCVSDANNSYAMVGGGGGATVAFESIDGPPPQVFDRMVGVLDSESKLRNLSVVSRQGQAGYRVRSYLAAEVSHGRTTISWVWDVYDANQQRALRLSGAEPTNRSGRGDAWAAADDLVLRKIAQAGFSGLTAMVNGTGPADDTPPAAAPGPAQDKRGPAVASAEPADTAANSDSVSALSYSSR